MPSHFIVKKTARGLYRSTGWAGIMPVFSGPLFRLCGYSSATTALTNASCWRSNECSKIAASQLSSTTNNVRSADSACNQTMIVVDLMQS